MYDQRTPSWMTPEHEMFADMVRKFFAAELVPNIPKWNKQGVVDRAFWDKAAEIGLLAATIPEAYGGAGGTYSFDAIIGYEQARIGDTGWGFGINTIIAHYISRYGTEAQKLRWLPRMASGELIPAIAMTEPGTGSDLQAVTTYADRHADTYCINGTKTFITNGQTANLICIIAKTDRDAGSKGISLIFAETDGLKGFSRGRNLEKLGMKANDTSELFFEDMHVPLENCLGGEEGKGFAQMMTDLPWERLYLGIGALGQMDFVLKETIAYTRQRKAFGQRVADFQNTRFKLAEVKTKIEVTRVFINDCIAQQDVGELTATTASMAKLWSTDLQNDVVDECLQFFGGNGFMMEYPIARAYADARVQKIYGGTNEIMKELIARAL
ncbi:MAG: acyl-CoA dehydrogenase family protein [Pseudomonadota bacterium]|jgi:acyl-CoA dehydrogenase